mmetsp:Transcript_24763/g.27554  ORF Transcript_24763/g.27554 Transcript_24763/m.27554 type:complete len:220 (+) Transcript_24763:378-1037(+)
MGFSFHKYGFDFSLKHHAAVLEEFLGQLKEHKPFVMCPSCSAALTCSRVASRRPDLISNVVIIQSGDHHEQKKWMTKSIDYKGLLSKPYIGQILNYFMRYKFGTVWLKIAVADRAVSRQWSDIVKKSLDNGAMFTLASYIQQMLPNPQHFHSRMLQPTKIIYGLKDGSHNRAGTNFETAGNWATGEVTYVQFPECAHFPELEDPDNFCKLLIEIARSNL